MMHEMRHGAVSLLPDPKGHWFLQFIDCAGPSDLDRDIELSKAAR
ncbi:MAG: Uncharacterised protein [Prochlorococcus marinus str. MIT 9313]|nr:MAG: Uncharacterised protein [Prochlorococcus marinus str. MIT 9313]